MLGLNVFWENIANHFLPESINLDQTFLKISQKTFKINHQKKVEIIL